VNSIEGAWLSEAVNLTVGQQIQEAREAKGWSQAKLEDRACLCAGYVSKVEAEILMPRFERLMILSEVLEVPLVVTPRTRRKRAERRAVITKNKARYRGSDG
jgi:transcriptional regulator with XRE-family HTH domain